MYFKFILFIVIRQIIYALNNLPDANYDSIIPSILSQTYDSLKNIYKTYVSDLINENKDSYLNIMETYIIFLYIIIHNINSSKKIITLLKSINKNFISLFKNIINEFKSDKTNLLLPQIIISLFFDDMQAKITSYKNNELNNIYYNYFYEFTKGFSEEYAKFFPSSNKYKNFMENIENGKISEILEKISEKIKNDKNKMKQNLFCRDLLPLFFYRSNKIFDFIKFFSTLVNQYIFYVKKNFNSEVTSLFRNDDLFNELFKQMISNFSNYSFITSFYFTLQNELFNEHTPTVEIDLKKFENFFKIFTKQIVKTLPYVIKILLSIINNIVKKSYAIKDENNLNVVYIVMIFNFYINPYYFQLHGLNMKTFPGMKFIIKIMRNICFDKLFDEKDKLNYFNEKIHEFHSEINKAFKTFLVDEKELHNNKELINTKIFLYFNSSGDSKNIALPSFVYRFYWENIVDYI